MATAPRLKAVPKGDELTFIDTARKIRQKHLVKIEDIPSDLSENFYTIAVELLNSMTFDPPKFTEVYDSLSEKFPAKQWKKAIETPAAPDQEASPQERPYQMHPLSFFKNMPKRQWGVNKLIYDRGTSAFVGDGGSGKSDLVLNMMLSRVYARQFIGRDVKQGFIVWVAAESVDEIYPRVYAWQLHHQVSTDEEPNIWFLDERVPFNNMAEVESFIESIQAQADEMHVTIDGFVFDTYARCTPGSDENSTQETKIIVASIDRISKAFNTHVAVIHHTNANNKIRGSTVFKNDLDTVWLISKEGNTIKMHCEKMRGTIEPEDFTLKMVSQILSDEDINETGPVIVAGDENDASELLTPRTQINMLDILFASGSLSSNTWAQHCEKAHQISYSTFNTHRKILLDSGLVEMVGEKIPGKKVTYTITKMGGELLG